MKKFYLVILFVLLFTPAMAFAEPQGWNPAAITGGNAVAIDTITFAKFDQGRVLLQFDYNQNTGDISRARCINNSERGVYGEVRKVIDPVTHVYETIWSGICNAGITATFPINRLNIQWNIADDNGDGLPDGGLIMGPYQFVAHWPA